MTGDAHAPGASPLDLGVLVVCDLLKNRRYFTFIPAALITRAHFAISRFV